MNRLVGERFLCILNPGSNRLTAGRTRSMQGFQRSGCPQADGRAVQSTGAEDAARKEESMEPSLTMEDAAQQVIKTLFRMCRDTRLHQQNVSDLTRQIPMDFASVKKVLSVLEREGYVETLTFGQKVAFTDAGVVIAQRLIR
jgi:hypothetical protein